MPRNGPEENYKTTKNLSTRAGFVARYSNRNWFAFVADHMAPLSGQVLDVGCGVGWYWQASAARWDFERLVLVDQSQAMCDAVRERLAPLYQIETHQADAAAVPLADASCAAVVAMHMLYHVRDVPAALAEMWRVLKPGGRLILTSVGDGDLGPLSALSREILGSAGSDIVEGAFGTAKAKSYLGQALGTFQHHPYSDVYAVDDAESVVDYVSSFPPGNTATPEAMDCFKSRVAQAIRDGGGTWEMERRQELYIVHKPGN